jgi:OOP family OmpA-OmpF porin
MRSRSIITLVLAGALALAAGVASAAAPEGSLHWLTPGAGYGFFANNHAYPDGWPLADTPVFGARLGTRLNPTWDLEIAGAYSTPKEEANPSHDYKAKWMNGSANLMFTPIAWKLGSPYLAAGGGYVRYDTDVTGVSEKHYGTFEQAVGWRSWMGEHVALRLEARSLLGIPYKHWTRANKSDQQFFAGLDFAWGGKPKDSDGDGVADRKDKCPGTPAGATVNASGCPTDADGDGVWDGLDKCLGTPRGATVDATGCPRDSDGDGVYDGLDKCPDTPKGATVDATGCPRDSDGDGVFDGLDQCANTPTGAKVDAKGCPIDSDGDGVWDGIDKCDGTAAGLKVDAAGCPIEVTEKETQLLDTGMIRLQGVNFETGKADLLPESYPALDEVGTILRKWPQLQIEIGGHTDARGAEALNQKLSDARAESVRSYLLGKFSDIQPVQLGSKGYGESRPIAPNNNALNMSKNRRVEFVVTNKDVLKKEIERRKMLTK